MNRKHVFIGLAALSLAALGGCPFGNSNTPLTGDLNLAPGFGTAIRVGTTSGIDDSPSCAGFFPENPNHTMTLASAVAGLTVGAVSPDANVVLYIRFGNSTFCADADDPTIGRGNWSAGDYEIFVGTEAPSMDISYTLTVSEP